MRWPTRKSAMQSAAAWLLHLFHRTRRAIDWVRIEPRQFCPRPRSTDIELRHDDRLLHVFSNQPLTTGSYREFLMELRSTLHRVAPADRESALRRLAERVPRFDFGALTPVLATEADWAHLLKLETGEIAFVLVLIRARGGGGTVNPT